MRESFIVISVYALIALAMAIAIAYLLGPTIDDLYVQLLATDMGSYVNTYRDQHIPPLRNATVLALALGIAYPFGWWVAKTFQRESEYNPYEYQYNQRLR